MTIAEAFKLFFNALNGQSPVGTTIEEVIRNGTANIERIPELPVQYEDESNKSFVLASSTASSTKEFRITVDDAGTVTATEIVAE